MRQLWTNNAKSTLASAITSSGATSLTVQPGDGGLFPNPGATDFFQVTLENGLTREIVKVTARSADTFTIVRGQEGTTATTFPLGATVDLRDTADALQRGTRSRTIGAAYDGGGVVLITTGVATTKVPVGPMSYAGTIVGVSIVTGVDSGSATIGVTKCSRTSYPGSLVDITGGNDVVLTSANSMHDTTLSGWTTTFSVEDVFQFQLKSTSLVKTLTIFLEIE